MVYLPYMQHKMKLTKEPFDQIAAGTKVIESRLYDEKRQKISIGDEIEFTENDNTQRIINTRVIGLIRYQTFSGMFSDHDASLFGGESTSALITKIHEFYSKEDESKYGVLGIRIEHID